MQTPVSRDILEQTTRCNCDFQCQTPQGKPCCGASRMIGGTALKLSTGTNGRSCSYLINYDGDQFCMCPTRQQIFRRYYE
jgi:hypothetical protein